jgi:hypothetical protein
MMLLVSKNLGLSPSPPSQRISRPGWRDPRLWIGVAIVAACVLLGARVLAAADNTVPVWSASADLEQGDPVGAADLTSRDVRFARPADADRYLSAATPLPADAVLSRDIGAGELLPRSALGAADASWQRTLTFDFTGPGVPAGLARGDRVDVYVTSVAKQKGGRSSEAEQARLVLSDVVVTDLDRASDSLAGSGARAVTVGIPAAADPAAVAVVVQAAKTDNLFLVKQG